MTATQESAEAMRDAASKIQAELDRELDSAQKSGGEAARLSAEVARLKEECVALRMDAAKSATGSGAELAIAEGEVKRLRKELSEAKLALSKEKQMSLVASR